jgi:hypothetical protein
MNLIGNINAIPFRRFRGGGGVSPIPPFPSIPGITARYSALGLTNEQMAENPVWKDLTGNGHDLQMKNFAWKGMSGVGGYGDENYQTFYKFTLDDYVFIANPPGVEHMNFTFRVTGLQPGNKLTLAFFGTTNTVYGTWDKDGIYTVDADIVEAGKPTYFYNGYGATRGEFTIEILPLYPGFILGDGVDDFAVTEKELNFEDTYTVYTAFIPFQNNPTRNMILCGADSKKTFSMQYSSLVYVSFVAGNNYYINADFVNGLNLFACKRNGNNICIKNLLTNKVVTGTCGDWVENAGPYYLWKNATYASFAKTAIAGQTICNGYFSTDEDDEKVLNWYKKQYPWLFPDQAWTVTGKTNEDEDRATIANITGNGNNLVLSNFGFAEGSGYGLYAYNFNSFDLRDNVVKPTDVKKDSFRIIGTGNSGNVLVLSNTSNSAAWKIRITGMKEGDSCIVGNANKSGDYIKIIKDGIYTFQKQYAATSINGIWYNSSQEVDVLVEQIPEYEGYLVTDGVDDEVRSAAFTLNEDWTIVGNWEFITNENKNAGLTKVYSLYLYNRDYGIFVYKYINAGQGFSVEGVKSLKAICSDGRIYLNDWQEIRNNIEQEATISKGVMAIGYFNRDFTKMAFKNLGIYNNQILSKDDCIKAYNYLQTLKSK